MLLRRINEHVKAQNWFAVAIDFIIVVVGVFMGIQIGNWNESRLDYIAYQQAQNRAVVEARVNIAEMERLIEALSPPFEDFKRAVEDIRTCGDGIEASERVNRAVKLLNNTPAPRFQNSAISQLTTSERLLDRQPPERRLQYAQYARRLATAMEYSDIVTRKMEMRSDELHPFLDYGPVENTPERPNSENARPLILTVELSEACKDYDFRQLFYRWEGGANYQMNLINSAVAATQKFLEELDESNLAEQTP
jgi:hypothetical protein